MVTVRGVVTVTRSIAVWVIVIVSVVVIAAAPELRQLCE